MKIERVYSRNVVTAPRASELREAAQIMRRFHVGSLIVTEDDASGDPRRAIGIVTDRDLVLKAIANGVGPGDAVVGDLMSEPLATIDDRADIYEAIEIMRTRGVRRLAVRNTNGAIVGVLSLDDVITAFGVVLGELGKLLSAEMIAEREEGHRAPVMIAVG